jgi:hypothetical protein
MLSECTCGNRRGPIVDKLRRGSKSMPKRKVLYVSHNHPAVRPGGAEAYALELYEAMRASDE